MKKVLGIVVFALGCSSSDGGDDLGLGGSVGQGGAEGSGCSSGDDADHDGTGGEAFEGDGTGGVVDPYESSIGLRCDSAGSCDPGQTCETTFWGERPVCTMICEMEWECPDGSTCLEQVVDLNGQMMAQSFCMVPCVKNDDCTGSAECDELPNSPGGLRYCW